MRHIINRQRGMALFLVLWVLVLLSVIVGEFCHATRSEVNITRNFKEKTQAYYIATAGINRAIFEVVRNERMPRRVKSPDESEEEEFRWRVNTIIPAIPFGQGQLEVWLGNESGKVNINQAGQSLLRMMLSSFDLEDQEKDTIVDSIMDWRDNDNLHRLNGAEDDYYQGLPEPYACKDRDFDSVEELLLVRGITPAIFHGGLKEMVTIYPQKEMSATKKKSTQKKTTYDFNRININAASPQMLLSLPGITEDMVQEIIEYRKQEDIVSLADLLTILGAEAYATISLYVTLKSLPYFYIQSLGTVEGSASREGAWVLIEVNTAYKKGYRIIEWKDGVDYPKG